MGLFTFLILVFIAYWIYVLFFASDETLNAWGKQADEKKAKRAQMLAAEEEERQAWLIRQAQLEAAAQEEIHTDPAPEAQDAEPFEGKGGSFGGGGASGSW